MKDIQKICKDSQIPIEELAKKLNVSVSIIHAWSIGISMPDLEQLKILLEVLHISADELLLGKKTNTIDISTLCKKHKLLVRNLYNSYIEINERRKNNDEN